MVEKNNSLDVRTKLIITLVNIVFIVSVGKGEYLLFSLYLVVAAAIILLFKPPIKHFIKRVFLVFLYPFCISIFIPFIHEGSSILTIDLNIFSLTITDNGITIFLTVIFKSFLSMLILTALVTSTDEIELLHGLRKIYFPKIIVSIIFLMYRYIFLIREEARIGQMAINSRVFQKSYRSVNKKLAYLAGNLIIESFDRAENVYKSMESRGFNGDFYIIDNSVKSCKLGISILFIFALAPLSLKTVELLNIL
ncbi:MAG: cobalt ECF transporter T component CbiQ [Actinobacteria bacterium]|nr:cobalt ECF transporter T component CbiQ [Actinomycetota bacterium]MBL7060655.1 cobalt ECF transporter T component CbiQ [Actinomycetota bacterium]